MNLNFFIIPLIAIGALLIGRTITAQGLEWYKTIRLPWFTPPGYVISIAWITIYILTTTACLIFWNSDISDFQRWIISIFFILNIGLNILWSYLFFGGHSRDVLFYAILDAAALDATAIILVILHWPISILAAVLILPYAIWTAFATFLTYSVWQLN